MCDSHRADRYDLTVQHPNIGDYVVREAEEYLWVHYGVMKVVDVRFDHRGFWRPPAIFLKCRPLGTDKIVEVQPIALRVLTLPELLVWHSIHDPDGVLPPLRDDDLNYDLPDGPV